MMMDGNTKHRILLAYETLDRTARGAERNKPMSAKPASKKTRPSLRLIAHIDRPRIFVKKTDQPAELIELAELHDTMTLHGDSGPGHTDQLYDRMGVEIIVVAGTASPDPACDVLQQRCYIIPVGPLKSAELPLVGSLYNEYLVTQTDQVRLRYIMRLRSQDYHLHALHVAIRTKLQQPQILNLCHWNNADLGVTEKEIEKSATSTSLHFSSSPPKDKEHSAEFICIELRRHYREQRWFFIKTWGHYQAQKERECVYEFETPQAAIEHFHSSFLRQTGNHWRDRKSFEKKEDKLEYAPPEQAVDENDEDSHTELIEADQRLFYGILPYVNSCRYDYGVNPLDALRMKAGPDIKLRILDRAKDEYRQVKAFIEKSMPEDKARVMDVIGFEKRAETDPYQRHVANRTVLMHATSFSHFGTVLLSGLRFPQWGI
ncbi:unnamed protein product, partial [Mesorhabditis spiculigera]